MAQRENPRTRVNIPRLFCLAPESHLSLGNQNFGKAETGSFRFDPIDDHLVDDTGEPV